MGKFFDATSRTAGPISTGRATPATFGGDSGLTGLGSSLVSASNILDQRAKFLEKKAVKDDITHVNTAMAEGGLQWIETLKSRSDNAKPGAAGFTDTMKTDFDKWATDGKGDIATQAGRDAWDLSAAKLKSIIIAKSIGFQATESARFITASVKGGVNNVFARARIDPSYYESGDAQVDLDKFAADLERRGLPTLARDVQTTEWRDNLAVSAASGEISNADTIQKAEELLIDITGSDKWSNVLGREAFATMKSTVEKKLVKLKTQKITDDNATVTAERRVNSERILVAVVGASGPNPDPADVAMVHQLRTEALNNPKLFDLRAAKSLDTFLDARAQKAIVDAELATKDAIKSVDLDKDWTLAGLEIQIEEMADVASLKGLQFAFKGLRRKTAIDTSGVTAGEFRALNLKIIKKMKTIRDADTKKRGDFDTDAAKKLEKEAATLSKLGVAGFNDKIARAKNINDIAAITAALASDAVAKNIDPVELIKLRTKVFKKEEKLSDAAATVREAEVDRLAKLDFLGLQSLVLRVKTLDEVIALENAVANNKTIGDKERAALQDKLFLKSEKITDYLTKEEAKLKAADNDMTIAGLDRLSRRDDLNSADIANLQRQANRLKDEGAFGTNISKWVTISARLDKGAIEAAQVLKRAQRVEAALLGLGNLSPTSIDDKKGVNEYYDAAAPAWDKEPPQIAVAKKVATAGRLNILPDGLRDEITAGLSSEKADDVVAAASLMSKLESVSPQISSQFGSGEAVSFGRQVLHYNRQGLTGVDAVARAKGLRNVSDDDKKARRDIIIRAKPLDELDIDSFFTDTIDDEIYGERSDDAVIPPIMRAEFNGMVQDEYMRTGDIDVAKNSVLATFRKVWGAHHQGDDTFLMRRPPNLFYGEGSKTQQENSAWIMEQLLDDMSASGAFAEPLTEDRVRIVEHPTVSNGKLPVYSVIILPPDTQEGLSAPVPWADFNGKPHPWLPKYSTSRQAERDRDAQNNMIQNSPAELLRRMKDRGYFKEN